MASSTWAHRIAREDRAAAKAEGKAVVVLGILHANGCRSEYVYRIDESRVLKIEHLLIQQVREER